MSTEIHEGPVSATQFGIGGGRLGIQITSAMPFLPDMGNGLGRFIQGEYADVVACAKAIVAFDAEKAAPAPVAGEAGTSDPTKECRHGLHVRDYCARCDIEDDIQIEGIEPNDAMVAAAQKSLSSYYAHSGTPQIPALALCEAIREALRAALSRPTEPTPAGVTRRPWAWAVLSDEDEMPDGDHLWMNVTADARSHAEDDAQVQTVDSGVPHRAVAVYLAPSSTPGTGEANV